MAFFLIWTGDFCFSGARVMKKILVLKTILRFFQIYAVLISSFSFCALPSARESWPAWFKPNRKIENDLLNTRSARICDYSRATKDPYEFVEQARCATTETSCKQQESSRKQRMSKSHRSQSAQSCCFLTLKTSNEFVYLLGPKSVNKKGSPLT